jgi:hypothetical protein
MKFKYLKWGHSKRNKVRLNQEIEEKICGHANCEEDTTQQVQQETVPYFSTHN